MKKIIIHFFSIILLLESMLGCAEYERTGVEKSIYVNKTSLSMFVGEQIQLIANPTEGTYEWISEDPSIASVTDNGLVKAVGEGQTVIIASSEGIQARVPLKSVVRIPLEDVILSETRIDLKPGLQKKIMVTFVPDNANDMPTATWRSENMDIATVNSAGEVKAITEGVTSIVYTIGNFSRTITVDITYTQAFNGPHILSAAAPCIISAIDFDTGGEGFAFHETTDGNAGGFNYRSNNGDNESGSVDIYDNGSFRYIGSAPGGEWLLYTIEVENAGDYAVQALIGSPNTTRWFRLDVDDVNVTGNVYTPNTGGYDIYQWIPSQALTLNFTAGKHRVKYYIGLQHNIREIKFTKM